MLGRRGDAEPAGAGQRAVQLMRETACAILLQPVAVVERRAQLEDRLPDLLLLRAQ